MTNLVFLLVVFAISEIDWPKKEGLLKEPILIDSIEVVRPFDGTKITTALFDLDGTLSLERKWIDLMVETNSCQLHNSTKLSLQDAKEIVIKDISKTYGVPTIICMDALVDRIKSFGGNPKESAFYKSEYASCLSKSVSLRRKTFSKSELSVFGSKDFVALIQSRLGKNIYLASGSDVSEVLASVEFLELSEFFPKSNIVGAGAFGDLRADPKKIIIDSLVKEKNLSFGELVTFGDGFPELLHNKFGVRVAVLTPNLTDFYGEGVFSLEAKRQRLIAAGADIIINNFSNPKKVLEVIFSKFEVETL